MASTTYAIASFKMAHAKSSLTPQRTMACSRLGGVEVDLHRPLVLQCFGNNPTDGTNKGTGV